MDDQRHTQGSDIPLLHMDLNFILMHIYASALTLAIPRWQRLITLGTRLSLGFSECAWQNHCAVQCTDPYKDRYIFYPLRQKENSLTRFICVVLFGASLSNHSLLPYIALPLQVWEYDSNSLLIRWCDSFFTPLLPCLLKYMMSLSHGRQYIYIKKKETATTSNTNENINI